MTISKKRKLLIAQLEENLALLHKSIIALDYSYDKCRAIGEKEEFDLEQQKSFEALTSRFGATSRGYEKRLESKSRSYRPAIRI